MQYNVDTPHAYLSAIEQDWRKDKLLEIRTMILEQSVIILEDIEYKMLSYTLNNHNLFHLNVQKHYVGLYVCSIERIDPSGVLLTGLNCGKGCIRISKSIDIQKTKLQEFITLAIELRKSGIDTSC